MEKNNPPSLRLTDEEYEFVYRRTPRLCVDLFMTVPGGGFVLTKRDIPPEQGLWHFPGGRVQYREQLSDAVKRIARAELNIDSVTAQELIGYMEFLHDGPFVHSVSLFVHAPVGVAPSQGSPQASQVKIFRELPKDMHTVQRVYAEKYWDRIHELMG